MSDRHSSIHEDHVCSEPNPYEVPASKSDSGEFPIVRQGWRIALALVLGLLAGGVGFVSTCGGIGVATVVNFGIHSTPVILAVMAYLAGGIVGLWLFLQVFRSIVFAKAATVQSGSPDSIAQHHSNHQKSP